jgi:Mg-chelatase subunit ChlD
MTNVNLSLLQVILLLDKSGSMNEQRLQQMKEVGVMIADDMSQLDQNGSIHVITFGGRVVNEGEIEFDNIKDLILNLRTGGTTPLAKALVEASLVIAPTLTGPEKLQHLIVVITDGEPDDKKAVVQEIVKLSKMIQTDEQLALQFVQVGDDEGASKFLQFLDDNIKDATGGLDLVNTNHFSDVANYSAQEFVNNAFND